MPPKPETPLLPFMPSPALREGFEEASRLQANIDRLFAAIGERARCAGCNAPIVWVLHKTGRKAPYDHDGVNHFITCPKREDFKRGKPYG